MKSNNEEKTPLDRLADGYDRMLERVDSGMHEVEESSGRFREMLGHAREKAVELEELSREEAEKISDYLARDVHDAAHYLAETGEELRQWFHFDVELIEARLLEAFHSVADKTRVELEQWSEQAREAARYQTGEVTGPGTLVCTACGKVLQFRKTGYIPPCPACSETLFLRPFGEGSEGAAAE